MIFIMLILMVIAVFFTVVKTNNKYSLIFTETLFSIVSMIMISVIFINSKTTGLYIIFPFEKHILKLLTKASISFFSYKSWVYLALSIYMISMLHLNNHIRRKRIFNLNDIPIYLVLLLNWSLSRYSVTEDLYIYYCAAETPLTAAIFKNIYAILYTFNILLIGILSVMPHAAIIERHKTTRALHLRNQLISTTAITVVLQFFTVVFIFLGPIKTFFTDNNIENIYSQSSVMIKNSFYIILTVYTAVIFALIIFVSVKCRAFDEVAFFKTKTAKKNLNLKLDDIKNIFHSMKNAIILLKMYNAGAMKEINNPENLKKILEESELQINSLISHVNKFLNSYQKKNLQLEVYSLNKIISCALHSIHQTVKADIIKCFEPYELMVFGDKQMLSDAIANILQNASEATSGRDNPQIKISTWLEDGFACVSIDDNGHGMNKKQLKKIYTPLYSTKKSYTNWGLGLSQAQKVVKAHLGFIDICSTENVGTQVQIVLPAEDTEVI